MVDAWSPAEVLILKVWDLLSLCLSVSKSGCVPFYLTAFHPKILERTICLVHLIASDWSRTSAELPHKIHCTFGSAGNLMTHPEIYGSSDPQARERFATPFSKNSTVQRTGTQKFLPILGQYHPLESFNCNCLIGIGGGKHINSLQSLDDAIHWSPSTVRELGHLVAPTGGEQVADACCKRKNCLPGKPY
ncbi:hypothetical protein TNCV_4212331 [Trichonephila clavipes]|nr:hypothetical protein TNCV_4212331 [Trichonephila clavipes]